MRLVFFGLSITSSWGNGHATTYRGLMRGLQRLGHRVEFFERNADWYAQHRDLPAPPGVGLTVYEDWKEVRQRALAAARDSDAVMVGSYYPDGITLLDELLGGSAPLVCFYDIDTPITLGQLRRGECAYLRADQVQGCDLYLSFTGGPVLEELHRVWGARRVCPLYCACDESCYRKVQRPTRPRHSLTFLGTYAADRQPKLQRLLLEPARCLPRQAFQVAGPMFPELERWPANCAYLSHLPPPGHPAFYAASRFTLNLTRQAMVEAGYSPSVRLFEAAAAATPLITDPWPGLEDFFSPESEVLVASDTQTVVKILTELSAQEAQRLGRAAQVRVLDHHTCLQRAAELESYLQAARHAALTPTLLS